MAITTKTENNTYLKLSIQVRLNGLSFCLLDEVANEMLWYKKINFAKEYNPVKSLAEIESLYKSEPQLSREVDEVLILFSNELYNLVPQKFFIEEEASNYLKYNTKILKTDVVAFDTVIEEELVNVYIPYTNITNYFFDKYGEFEYRHSISVLVQEVNKIAPDTGVEVFLNNSKGYYDLVVFRNKKLLLCNTFSYETKEDFIYYLLFTAEQLRIDPAVFKLTLLGELTEHHELFQIIYTYIKDVNFLEPKFNNVVEGEVTEEFKREAYLILKSLK